MTSAIVRHCYRIRAIHGTERLERAWQRRAPLKGNISLSRKRERGYEGKASRRAPWSMMIVYLLHNKNNCLTIEEAALSPLSPKNTKHLVGGDRVE
jgi:hypothetical protein